MQYSPSERENAELPVVSDSTAGQRVLWALSVGAAFLLLAAAGFRIALQFAWWDWWTALALLAGVAAADFSSGLVHWGADTWGRDDLPVIGPRLLVPFRVHHINPDDLLRRRFLDANGDVALLAVPLLAGVLMIPLDAGWGPPLAVFGLGFCGAGMMTNQIHQWAHMPSPPRVVVWLQRCRLVLGRRAHAVHHQRPYDAHYCITTGWCNRPLETIGLFRRLEGAISRLTGVQPRHDDRRYEEQFARARAAGGSRLP